MRRKMLTSCALALAGAVVAVASLSITGADAAPQGGQPPFRNAVEQREEMIRELREIKLLIKEQNALLRGLAAKGKEDALGR